MGRAKIIDDLDNVVVSIDEIKKDEVVSFSLSDGSVEEITALEEIPVFHKLARNDIKCGEKIVKYGEHIGESSRDIKAGEHVHTHNVSSVRENL
ncbi:MAG: UxaA family hydrolase [Clostridioides sp.]|jgi:altronate dehydratase|nr:UxaA family hydrolase [Clostridioides sp.]